MPLLINQFGTERRMCMAFGVDSLDELGQRVTDVLEMQPPEGLVDKVRALQKLKSLADSRPKTVSRGACQEIVLDPPSLESLPVMTCWPGDGGPYITLPAVITKDPRSGTRNVGMYRVQVFDATTTGEYIAPYLVGGPDDSMFGNFIYDAFATSNRWNFGSVLSLWLMFVVLGLVALSARYLTADLRGDRA